MSFSLALVITLVRSLLVVAVAIPICGLLCRMLQSSKRRWLAWSLLLLPVVAPRMLTGFGYANFSLSLAAFPIWNECLYGLLLLLTVAPVGTLLRYFAPPPPISTEGLHVWELGHDRASSANATFAGRMDMSFFRGVGSQYFAACGLMFLLAFQEFELASLLGVNAWTVWLFDAQAGGLFLSETLRYAVLPLLLEILVLALVGYLVWRNRGLVGRPRSQPKASNKLMFAGWAYLGFGLVAFCLVPWSFVVAPALGGIAQLSTNFAIGRDIFAGCIFALLAASAAYFLAGWMASRFVIRSETRHSKTAQAFFATMGLPGLLGSLVLGLSILFAFQTPPMGSLYGTPIPWLSASILFLAPRAILVFWLFAVLRSEESNHLTNLMAKSPRSRDRHQARELKWHSLGRLHYTAFALLFFWAYCDLTMASILAPPGATPAPVRLYNLMHYGESAVLCAMTIATFGVPALIFGSGLLFRRPLQKVLMP